jgi:sulfur carrier protein ThiS
MVRVHLRLYAELNALVPAAERQRDLCRRYDTGPSVKDAIERLGIPHTEVDLVLVNGDAVGFAHRLADGDRVSVYPLFRHLDVSALSEVRPEPLGEARFVLDGHL